MVQDSVETRAELGSDVGSTVVIPSYDAVLLMCADQFRLILPDLTAIGLRLSHASLWYLLPGRTAQ